MRGLSAVETASRVPGFTHTINALMLILAVVLPACASVPSPLERREHADTLAASKHWQRASIPAGAFRLVVYGPPDPQPQARLAIYIEGDGFAWIGASQPSSDPTPRDPLALRLALAHPEGNAVYVARPCQYVDSGSSTCARAYWTGRRFSEEVIEAFDDAIEKLKMRYGARHLTLVGYSGGGAIAALVAARRTDVDKLVTVAGNLDHRAWTNLHALQPLAGSLNPADETDALVGIRQWHFAGSGDRIIPPSLAQSFAEHFPAGGRPMVRIEAGYDHRCCWVENWSRLWEQTGGLE